LWAPALDRHQAIFGRAPDLAAADRGFSSGRWNETTTQQAGRLKRTEQLVERSFLHRKVAQAGLQ
jgi:hypothetical protein